MFSSVSINEDLTYSKFGYNSNFLDENSRKCVAVECDNCNSIMEREFRNAFKKHQCSVLDGNNKRCFKCLQWKDLSFFNKSKNLSGGVSKTCRSCYNEYDCVKRCNYNKLNRLKNSFHNDFNLYLKSRLSSIKSRCKKNNIKFDLDLDFILNQWNIQKGLCYYSSLAMEADGKVDGFQGWKSPSIDRKDPRLGYIKGNIVWCCFSINSFKQNLTCEEFYDKLKEIKWIL
jgi:hypothetical protein